MDFRELGILRLLEQDRERFEGIPLENRYDPPMRILSTPNQSVVNNSVDNIMSPDDLFTSPSTTEEGIAQGQELIGNVGDFLSGIFERGPAGFEQGVDAEGNVVDLNVQPTTTVEATRPSLFPGLPNYTPAGTGATPFLQTPPRRSGDPNAPYSFVTAKPETYVDLEGHLQTVGDRADLFGAGGDKLKVMESMPTVSGRDFRSASIIQAEQDKIKSEQEKKSKARIWGNYSYDPQAAQKRYEDSMRSIYSKAMILNALAGLTGGKSMSGNFIDMATKRLEMEETFRDQGRLQDIQRGIYYTQDGLYDPPKNQQEAFDRAMKFGASPALAEKISGYAPTEDTRAYNNWYNTETGEVEVRRTGDKPEGKNWVRGTPSAKGEGSPGTRVKFLNELRDIALTGNLEDAINRYISYKMLGSNYVGGNSSLLRKEAYQAVFGTVPSQNKVKLEIAPTEEEEIKMKQQNPNLLYWMSADGKMGVFN